MSPGVLRLSDYESDTRYQATVVSSERITSADAVEVRELVLEVERSDRAFQVGQSIGVYTPGAAALGGRTHFRLYSIADLPGAGPDGRPRLTICVRRCTYVDPYSGEEYPGVASNYLCDRRSGDPLTIGGPFGMPFAVPEDHDATLILIGSGTGIAPFRALVKHVYRDVPDWRGTIWLFYGAQSGLELLYMNDEKDDFAQYYDRETFRAFKALSRRPNWADPIGWDGAIGERGAELWKALGDPRTHVYVAGLEKMRAELDKVFAGLAGSEEKWARRKAELMAGGRWVELLY
jgi:ferredoxin--NADP+ reductase